MKPDPEIETARSEDGGIVGALIMMFVFVCMMLQSAFGPIIRFFRRME